MTKKKPCDEFAPRFNGYAQQLHTMATLCAAGDYKQADKLLALVQAKLVVLSVDLRAEYHKSGEGKA